MKPATRAPGRRRLDLDRSGPWIAAIGLLAVLWLVVSSTLYAPWWGVLLHLVVLGGFVALYARRVRERPASTIWIAVAAFVAWIAVNAVGVLLLDWRL
ncbi:hypothetical protein [Aeromicrobium sp. Leaf350]|uniref:hypothetical protein n=1 Tax=Aeromicrobium sp. Leaf350 TaxID=2876565 RepID=UPI001E2D2B56|nr:hypothetical protein [Aeromicrobium sp. Leaf350]